MPDLPDVGIEWDVDLPGSRFARTPSVAVGVPEQDWDREGTNAEADARETIEQALGSWALETDPELGTPEAVPGSVGRGAAGLAAVLEFVAAHAVGGVISTAAGLAFKRFIERARDASKRTERRVQVSRGGAAYLAVAEISDHFEDPGPLEVEAVEEPSYIGGRPVSELSFVGVEPWVALLLNRAQLRRYLVVISPAGEILGSMVTPMGEWEHVFLQAPEEGEWAKAPPPRTRWWRR